MQHNEKKIENLLTRELDILENAISDENKALAICSREEIWKLVDRLREHMYQKAIEDYKKENYSNPTYYETIVKSDIWKEWTRYAEENMLFDMAESIECGWLSKAHWEAFINWVKTNENKNTTS